MERVGGYVERYGGEASLLVGVEHYTQSVSVQRVTGVLRGRSNVPTITSVSQVPGQKRQLVSEFALVPNASASGGWLGYRDVMEVDGRAVADRHDRLLALFQSEAPDLEAARRITDESARYNIGPVRRNFNVPTATLFFFHPGNLSRFTFRRKGTERIEGIDAVAVEFRETRMPTLIMNATGDDVPASGTLWVNPADGAVVRTRIELDGFHGKGSHAEIVVWYQKDAAVGMWVPSRMEEKYSGGAAGGDDRRDLQGLQALPDVSEDQMSARIRAAVVCATLVDVVHDAVSRRPAAADRHVPQRPRRPHHRHVGPRRGRPADHRSRARRFHGAHRRPAACRAHRADVRYRRRTDHQQRRRADTAIHARRRRVAGTDRGDRDRSVVDASWRRKGGDRHRGVAARLPFSGGRRRRHRTARRRHRPHARPCGGGERDPADERHGAGARGRDHVLGRGAEIRARVQPRTRSLPAAGSKTPRGRCCSRGGRRQRRSCRASRR